MSAGVETEGRDWRLLARAAGVGFAGAVLLFYALVAFGTSPRDASELVFPLAALPFSLGLLGWSAVLLSGEAIETFSAELGVSESWTVESGRQGTALLVVFGLGGMVGAAVAGAPYGV
ncbi:hypothetical protein KTS45_09795 [Halomicroarcula limicola]|uniref:Uncharacterized protein n=1 Tax=Haloarcula limicola TaxID=1429915 RepID=A0A8J8C3H0_9EURY|nr:hypothetical protein [Halomicroarcula limicola]MBV0924491.1 hypothetical protein [Halomicroarcula limicola]